MLTNVFQKYALYYDLLYASKDYKNEADYIFELIQRHTNTTNTIIDLGCGTGIHSKFLADKGMDVLGIDFSDEMIKIASTKTKENLSFEQGDIRTFRSNDKKDTAVSLFHVMSYQTTYKDIEDSFITAYECIKDDGLFIFDLWYGPGVLTDRPAIREKNLENDFYKIKRKSTPNLFENSNVVNVNFEIEILNKRDQSKEVLEETHPMRYYFNPEIEYFTNKVGFKIVGFYEWLTQKTPNCDSWNVVYVCKKILS